MNSPKQLTFPWNRVNKFSFEGFYIDPKNAQLLSLLMDTSSSNDLFIHGFKDSGKTFLLQSLCNLYNTNNKTSLYLPLKEVMTYGVDILDSLEKMDLVCIDSVESIISNTEWEIAIFNLINKSLHKSILFDDFLSVRKLALKEIPLFSDIDFLPIKNQVNNSQTLSLDSNEKIEIKPIDYYYSNAITRASKTMSDCRNINIKNKKNGTNN